MTDEDTADRDLWHLLIHTPGPNADPDVPFFEAPWFPHHRGFLASLQEGGYLVAAGPLPTRPGAGQTLVRGIGTAEITRRAEQEDPAVAGGFLTVDVVPWRVVDSVLDA